MNTQTLAVDYILPLQTQAYKVVGVYRQGSYMLGYNDEFSDNDFSVIWETDFPPVEYRKQAAKNHGLEIVFFGDQDHKGTDRFMLDGVEHNISHQKAENFFALYYQVCSNKINEVKLYILGGFSRSEIIYDDSNKLQTYKDSIPVNAKVLESYDELRKIPTQNNLQALKIAVERNQTVEALKSLNYLLLSGTIATYLQYGMYPNSPKWFEKDANKYGWQNNIVRTIKILNESTSLPLIQASLLEEIK
jgi:hypothetical protein